MWDVLKTVFSPSQYIPHGHCYLWQTNLVWLHLISDLLIAIAYFSIPALLIYFVRMRGDMPFTRVFSLFGAFIILCGLGHLLDIWTLWHPAYWLTGIEHALTAIVSCCTALQMIQLLPKFLTLKSPEYVEGIKQKLLQEIAERQQAEQRLSKAYDELEQRVQERTSELLIVNLALEKEMNDRQQIAEEVRHSKEFLQKIIDTIPQNIFWKDRNSVYLGCNQKSAKIAGVGLPENIIGKTDYDLAWKPEEADLFVACDRRVMQSNIPELHIIEPQQQADGKQAWLDTSKIPLQDAEGNVIGILALLEDITDRKTLEEERRILSSILETTSDFIGTADPQCKSLYINRAWRDLLGIPDAQTAQEVELSSYHPKWALEIVTNQGIPEAVRTGIWMGETAILDQQAEEIPVSQLIIAHRSDEGEIEYFSTIARDISERKRIEAALQQKAQELEQALTELKDMQTQLVQNEKMSSLGQLVAGVAHEINNPTSFIRGNLRHAEEYVDDLIALVHLYQTHYPYPVSAIQAAIEAIDLEFLEIDLPKLFFSMNTGTERIEKIVLLLRNFSRIDEAEYKAVDIHEGIESALMILKNRLRNPHLAIEVIRDYGKLPPVECYAGELNQVFMNIFVNAIDALESRYAYEALDLVQPNSAQKGLAQKDLSLIHICTQAIEDQFVTIQIADNGTGMTEETRQRLFDPFFTTKPVGKGTGMGLSISYQIVKERHRGKLECISAPGEGAKFIIQIPIRQGAWNAFRLNK